MADGQRAERLDSWKEIAAYLGRDVTTVRRWEKHEGLPVHRHIHRKLGSVFAYRSEVDAWWNGRRTGLGQHDTTPASSPATPEPERGSVRFGSLWAPRAAAVIVVAILAGASVTFSTIRPSPERNALPVRLAVAAPIGTTANSLALSPDGALVAFAAAAAGARPHLWVRRLDSTDAQRLPGTAGAAYPFWSPDNQSVGFFAEGKLKRIALPTREVREVADAPDGRGGTWNGDGTILFAPDRDGPLVSVPAGGGQTTPRTTVASASVGGHAWPEFLPDGRHFLYLDYTNRRDRYGIYVGDLETGTNKRLLPVYSRAGYAPGGFLLYQRNTLVAQRFDADALEVSGEPVSVAGSVLQDHGLAHHVDFSTSPSGLLAVREHPEERYDLAWLDRTGRTLRTLGKAMWYSNPTLSPDGRRAVVTVGDDWEGANLWHVDLDAGTFERLTFADKFDFAPVWSPDGERIIFASMRGGRLRLYSRLVAGDGIDELLFTPPFMTAPDSWSPRGDYLTLNVLHGATRYDVWAWSPRTDRQLFPLLQGDYNEGQSQISPDGGFIAYASDETGRFEVYVQSFPEPGRKWQVSTAGGFEPRWRGDGRELLYIAANGRMTAVDVTTRGRFATGRARELFQTGLYDLWQDTRNHYDVTPDGSRFLMMRPETDPRTLPFTVVINRRAGLLPGGH